MSYQYQQTTSDSALQQPKPKIEYKRAGFWIRTIPFIVDSILMGIVTGVLSFFLSYIGFIVSFILPVFYCGFFYEKYSSTPGKMLFGLKVVRTKTGEHPDYMDALLRDGVGKALSMIIFGVGYLMVAFRSDKQALHDIFSKTTVLVKD